MISSYWSPENPTKNIYNYQKLNLEIKFHKNGTNEFLHLFLIGEEFKKAKFEIFTLRTLILNKSTLIT
jgi:hypothetical protein